MSSPSKFRVEYLLPFACAASAVCLGASEFMNTFELDLGPGAEVRTLEAGDRHSYVLLLIAVFAIGFLVAAVASGSRPAAVSVAVCGAVALLVFAIIDLPDVGQEGTVDDPSAVLFTATTEPSGGFWLALIGSVGLTAAGVALASLRPEQLRALRPGGRREDRTRQGSHQR